MHLFHEGNCNTYIFYFDDLKIISEWKCNELFEQAMSVNIKSSQSKIAISQHILSCKPLLSVTTKKYKHPDL